MRKAANAIAIAIAIGLGTAPAYAQPNQSTPVPVPANPVVNVQSGPYVEELPAIFSTSNIHAVLIRFPTRLHDANGVLVARATDANCAAIGYHLGLKAQGIENGGVTWMICAARP